MDARQSKRTLTRLLVSANDLVPIFGPHQALSESPQGYFSRETVRAMKKSGEGYFVSHGNCFRLNPALQSPEKHWEELLHKYGVRDESCCPDEETMFRFVVGERRAVAIISAWCPAGSA